MVKTSYTILCFVRLCFGDLSVLSQVLSQETKKNIVSCVLGHENHVVLES